MNQTLSQNQATQEPSVELTPDQIKEMRVQRSQWYKEQIGYLKPQLEYHKLVADIEVCKATFAEAQLKQAQIYLAVKGNQSPPEKQTRGKHKQGSPARTSPAAAN